MSTTKGNFVERCEDIVKAKPNYSLGSSDLHNCDCIGMPKYSLRKNGVSFTTSGTNWTFRNQVKNIRKITGTADLKFGDVVFKAKEPGDSGYNLPSKYRKGGSAYNGDLRDYCHIGVVKSVNPLKIIHMTSPTAKTDTAIGKWKFAAELLDQYVNNGSEPTPAPEPTPDPEPTPTPASDQAIVVSENGGYVKLRANPSTSCNLWDKIVPGTKATIVTFGYDWCKVNCGKRKGWYMMTRFLDVIGDGQGKY